MSYIVLHDRQRHPAILISKGHTYAHLVGSKDNESIGVITAPLQGFDVDWFPTMQRGLPYSPSKAAEYWLAVQRAREVTGISSYCSNRAIRILKEILANKDDISIGDRKEDEGRPVTTAPLIKRRQPKAASPEPEPAKATSDKIRSIVRRAIAPVAAAKPAKPPPSGITAKSIVQYKQDAPANARDSVKAVAAALKKHKKPIAISALRELLSKPCKDNVIKLVAWGCAVVTE